MSHYISTIKRIASEKKIKQKDLAEAIGLTEGGFHQSVRNNTLRIDKLFKICEILEISPAELLKEDVQELREENPGYGMNDADMLKEVLKTVKSIEHKINSSKRGK